MKRFLTHPAVTALGLTQIYLLAQIGQALSPDHVLLYHWNGPAASIFLSVILLFCLLWFALTLLLLVARSTGKFGVALWVVLLAPAPYELIRSWCMHTTSSHTLLLSSIAYTLIFSVSALVLLNRKRTLLQHVESIRRAGNVALGFVAIAALFSLGQILWAGWSARNPNALPPLHQSNVQSPPEPRIIWVLFDELSYRQVYERRYPGLQLPAFDQLAGQATLFTNAVPVGVYTQNAIPSLFTGQPVSAIRSSSDGRQLFFTEPGSNKWVRFDPHATVFQDALDRGYSTAIAGWYNPYCRIMPEVLDQCYWTLNSTNFGPTSPDRNPMQNALELLAHKTSFLPRIISLLRKMPVFDTDSARLHQMDYTEITAAADRLLEDPSARFVFLHIPVPHPGGIYNRSTGQFVSRNATYIDNLALADKYLGHIHLLLQQNGTWDSSTIIVMGDHSWRTFIWRNNPSWTAEEERASDGGRFDPRPGYIVKLPYQYRRAHIDFPYAAIHTRALFDALIAGEIHSPEELSTWAAQWHDSASSAQNLPAN